MDILVLGAGRQGRAAIYDLVHSPDVTHVVAADADIAALRTFVETLKTDKVTAVHANAGDLDRVAELMTDVEAAIVLLPTDATVPTAGIAIAQNCHWLSASYTHSHYRAMHDDAVMRGVTLLPELGLDPGIDLLLAAKAIAELDEIHEFYSYGAGIPEREAADNPLNYKISWTFAGVLRSYSHPARLLRDGNVVDVPAVELFSPYNLHTVDVPGVGELEAYPNGDAVRYVDMLGLQDQVRHAGRYSLRWPGHAELWRVFSRLGFLREEPVMVGKTAVIPQHFLRDLLTPQLQYRAGERDIALVRVDARGLKNGVPTQIIYQVVDRRDLATGFLAMQRTVGYTISIGAQMIVRGDITKRGLLSPLTDVPPDIVFAELAKRGIVLERWEEL